MSVRPGTAPRGVLSLLAAVALAAAVAAGTVNDPARAAAPPRSPLLGVNMSFFGGNDAMVTQKSTQALFRSWGVPFVRVPLRDHFDDANKTKVSDARLVSAMRAVKNVGATPMLIIRGPADGLSTAQVKSTDLRLLKLVDQVFGNGPAYLEFGNEPDLAGISAADYTATWNAVVPALKAAYPKAAYEYVGPVASRVDHAYADYVGTFVAGAKPEPDYLSWHEYVCGSQNDDDWKTTCVTHLANWQTHVTQVESRVRGKLGKPLPYFISEWNADPSDQGGVYKDANSGYLASWTTTAIDELGKLAPAPSGAMIYTATDHDNFGLVTGADTVTPQGEAFRAALTGAAPPPEPPGSGTPATEEPTPTDTPSSGSSSEEPPSPAPPSSQTATVMPPSGAPSSPATPSGMPSGGNQYYVAPDGADSGDGSKAHPWKTIQYAAEHAKAAGGGATVHVADGTYAEAVENEASGRPGGYLTFVADHRWQAKIVPASSGIPFENRGSYVRIEGFDISAPGGGWSGILTWGAHNVIQGNHVHDVKTKIGSGGCNGSPGGDGIGDDGSSSQNAFIANLVDHIGPYPTECEYIHGIYPSGAGDLVQNNITFDSSGSGIRFNHNATGATITNNLSFANADHGIFISGGVDNVIADRFVISNNIVRNNAKFGINIRSDASGAHNQYRDNLFYGNDKGAYGKDSDEEFTPPNSSGTVNADPEMVGYRADGTGDYHLTAASPCVDAGVTGATAGAPAQDFDGVSRPQGRADDIGPYEFRTASPPTS